MDKGYAFHFSKQNKVFTWSEKKIKETENAPAQKLKKDERLKVKVYIFSWLYFLYVIIRADASDCIGMAWLVSLSYRKIFLIRHVAKKCL